MHAFQVESMDVPDAGFLQDSGFVIRIQITELRYRDANELHMKNNFIWISWIEILVRICSIV